MIINEAPKEISPVMEAYLKCRSMVGTNVKKNKDNNHLKSKFADLDSVFTEVEDALSLNDFILLSNGDMIEDKPLILITTTLLHKSGGSIVFQSKLPVAKLDPQGYGSAITYGRRYALLSIFNLIPSDDDGQGASKSTNDVLKSLRAAPDEAARKEVLGWALKYFAKDEHKLAICREHYDKVTAEKNSDAAKGFVPVPRKKKANAEPEQINEDKPVQAEDKPAPIDPSMF